MNGNPPWKPAGTAGPARFERIFDASFDDSTTAGIFGSVGAVAGSSRTASGVAPTPGVRGSPCQNQLYFALPLCDWKSARHGPSGHTGPRANPSSAGSE